MLNPFEQALAQADKAITDIMMSPWLIDGVIYPATYDEVPQRFEGMLQYNEEYRVNGTKRTLTLFKESGYRPRVGDRAEQGDKQFLVKAFELVDQLIILQLE
ncbi:phage tail protein [Gallibacterium anatis]|uniref:Phage tail protein n=1 Tax=Gallibacterium anatis TaxID=750 RepID=A0AAX3XEU1_9PAST|nr:phage tail protein [Gallibacterium anatis]MDK9430936.1 phage tail protein [Gallibacterium anatis]WIM80090.1 phage tail protein [Gallibacterium anatis]